MLREIQSEKWLQSSNHIYIYIQWLQWKNWLPYTEYLKVPMKIRRALTKTNNKK